MIVKKKKTIPMHVRVKRAVKKLTIISHKFIKERDSQTTGYYRGFCCSCGKYCEGSDYQAGHWIPSGSCGAILRFHPQNMAGQGGFCCNINRNHQQKMGVDYTLSMIKRYGLKRVNELRALKQRTIKADLLFYEKMIELYEAGDEKQIIKYLENLK